MIFDDLQMFHDAADISNVLFASQEVDLGVPNIGAGEPVPVFIQGSPNGAAAFAIAGTATLNFGTSAAPAGVKTVHWSAAGLTAAQLIVGRHFDIPKGTLRYATLELVPDGASTLDAGLFTAGIVVTPEDRMPAV